jgi:hypothetical protein
MVNAVEFACELGEARAGRDAQARAPPEFHKKNTPPPGGASGV